MRSPDACFWPYFDRRADRGDKTADQEIKRGGHRFGTFRKLPGYACFFCAAASSGTLVRDRLPGLAA